MDGVALAAPEGHVFVLAVVRDFDEDGAADAFAIVRPPDGNDPGAPRPLPGRLGRDARGPCGVRSSRGPDA